ERPHDHVDMTRTAIAAPRRRAGPTNARRCPRRVGHLSRARQDSNLRPMAPEAPSRVSQSEFPADFAGGGDHITSGDTEERRNSAPKISSDPVEEALAQALAGAAADKRWDVVAVLSRELTERRREREDEAAGPETSITNVAAFRRSKREGK